MSQRRAFEIRSYFFADTFKGGVHFSGSFQRSLHVRKDVLFSKMANKFSLLQHPGRLLARAADEKSPAGLAEAIGKELQRMKTGCIDGRHVAHPENDHGGELLEVLRFFGQLTGASSTRDSMRAQRAGRRKP
jgi:hypothetical protein